MRILPGLAALASSYKGFLLDQWGVLHDGGRPYPGAIDCLTRLRASGAQIIILSNSGRRGSENVDTLERMGFARCLYDDLISAGDAARAALATKPGQNRPMARRRCLLMARAADRDLAAGLDVELVDDVASADFLFLMSMDSPRQSVAGWNDVLVRGAARDLTMICGNPDLHRVSPNGASIEAPGLVAQRYEQLGGRVEYYGKPHPDIYADCFARLKLSKAEVVAVGDSLLHDIAGARGVGISSVFVAAGVHRDELGVKDDNRLVIERLESLLSQGYARPDFAVERFVW